MDELMGFESEWHGRLPSTNEWHELHTVRGRTVIGKSSTYERTIGAMAQTFRFAAREPMGSTLVDLHADVCMWKMRDTDNCLKPMQDALSAGGVIDNDRHIRDLHVHRRYHTRDQSDYLRVGLVPVLPLPFIRSAAIRFPDGTVLVGESHADILKLAQKLGIDKESARAGEQGFVTNRGEYVDRRAAAEIAYAVGQIIERVPELLSEHLRG